MVNDSADVTSSGRSFQVWAGDQKSSATNNRKSAGTGRHCQAIDADRTQRSSTGLVGDTCEGAEVPRCKSVDDFICQDGDLELDSLMMMMMLMAS